MSQCRVVIIGGKGTAINLAEQIEDARSRYEYPMKVIGFAIDDRSLWPAIAGLPVLCGVHEAWTQFRETDVKFLFALYRPDVMLERLSLLSELEIPVQRFANFVHPTAYLATSVSMGKGNVVFAHSSLQHGVTLGNFNIINSNVVIEHEATLQNGSFIAASACIGARVRVGNGVFIGLNSTVREDIVIADGSFVGMASSVLQSVDAGTMVYGSPARPKG